MNNKKVISGKTILLNTVTNSTYIASNLDEQVQTGSRNNDKHIKVIGELDVKVCEWQYKPIAEKLWDIIDDIDSASDMFRPDDEKSYKTFMAM